MGRTPQVSVPRGYYRDSGHFGLHMQVQKKAKSYGHHTDGGAAYCKALMHRGVG